MITFDDARQVVSEHAVRMTTETVALRESCGRFLARDIAADRDVPPHDMSAMDGYACRRQDADKPLTVVEFIPAGHAPEKVIGQGECAQIMTGAPVPEGADTVMMVEYTERTGDTVTFTRSPGKSNIRAQGEELKAGDTVLAAGIRIGPAETAVLATVGCDPVPVAVRPRVGVIATGDELVEPAATPGAAHIRNSNSYQLCAQVAAAGSVPTYFGIARDTPEATAEMLGKALADSDVVMLSGGVSMGEHDYVPGVLRELGVELLFEKVAVQPGKPTVFGITGDKRVFGMPGNPVSTYVLFELLVRPFLCRMMGGEHRHTCVHARLAEPMKRRKADRLSFRPVTLAEGGAVFPVKYHGSAHMHAYVAADGLVAFNAGETELAEGTMVEVVLLNG